MLDNVIDLNFYPLLATKKTNLKNRAIGLGAMGEAQMLAENSILFGTQDHFQKIDEIFESISFNAIKASSELAKEKGSYKFFEDSFWSKGIMPIDTANKEALNLNQYECFYDWNKLRDEVKKNGMRNGYLMAIAPTSSISIVTGTTQTIEPIYKVKWQEENLSGMHTVVVPNFNINTKKYYISAYQLNQVNLIQSAAVRQKWLDQSQSINIFLVPETTTGKTLNRIYTFAWKYGVKTTYYLRSQSPKTENDVINRDDECLACQ
jgi:ribonucleoside-diphosphate reductase alpha chain